MSTNNKLKRDIFQRPTRFTHRFDGLTADEPHAPNETFDPEFPTFPNQHSKPLLKKRLGQHEYCEPLSPVVKPSGRRATMNGPAPDPMAGLAAPIPANTKKRNKNNPT